MIRRISALACAFVLAATFLSPPVLAQQGDNSDQLGEIDIIVTDVSTKQPVQLARVLLDGPVITTEFTGNNGKVRFIDVPDGIYLARIVKRGYDAVESAQFEVLEGRAIAVNVALAPSTGGLKIIATVAVKSTASVTTSSLSDDSAQRRLSTDLLSALGKLSGVAINSSSDDSDATETISLNGHDASQTQLSVDGIPLNAPGSAGNAGAFSDLYSGGSVNTSPSAGALGGSVSFRTLEPTLTWDSVDSLDVGSNGRYNYSLAETGTSGKFGFVAQVAHRLAPSLVDGEQYLDASGLDYTHEGDTNVNSGAFKLRYTPNENQAITGEYLSSDGDSQLVCLRNDGSVPCGYGPNNFTNRHSQLFSVVDSALIGDTSVQASVYGFSFGNDRNELNGYLNGIPNPQGTLTNQKATGFSLSAMLPAKERHTLSIQASNTASSFTESSLVPSEAFYYTGGQQTSYGSIQLNDSIQSSTKLIFNESFGLSHSSNAPVSILASSSINWQPTKHDGFAASYGIGGNAAHPGRSTILTDPTSLSFNCDGDFASGEAPGDQPGASSSTYASASYTHKWNAVLVTTSLYKQVQDDVVLPTQVNGTVINGLGLLPPGYINEVGTIFDSPAGCGLPAGTPFGAQNLYFSTPVGGVRRVYEGGNGLLYATWGSLIVQANYTVNVAKAISNDPRIDNSYSYVISGSQIPNVPLQTASVVLAYQAPHSVFQYLADADYTGTNNQYNLPAFTTFDAAVSAKLPRGTLTVVAANFTNRFGGIFTSPLDAVPFQTQGGTLVPTLARPLAPRTYQVSYLLRFGRGVAPLTLGQPSPTGGGRGRYGGRGGFFGGGPPGGPGAQGRPGGGRAGFFAPLPTSPPSDPFAQSSSELCTADASAQVKPFLDGMKAYVAQIEAAKTVAGYPATMPAPNIPNVSVTYHGLGSTYALTIAIKTPPPGGATPTPSPSPAANARGTRNFGGRFAALACLQMHFARADDVNKDHLYAPPMSIFGGANLTFMPAVGLYIAQRQPQAGQESFRLYKLPSKAPANSFAIVAQQQCTGDVKATATQVLGELQAHFAKGAPTPSWQIVAHQGKGGTWYELNANDLSVVQPILYCGKVAAAQTTDLTPLGLDGARPPSLNYAPSLGLYLVRNFGGPGGPGGPPTPTPAPTP